jgi:hypothetical protein
MGHLSPKHDIGSVMASLHPQMHLKGRLGINLIVLVVTLLLDGEKFLVHEEDVFFPILSVQLEEMLCSCPSNFLQSRCGGSMKLSISMTGRDAL